MKCFGTWKVATTNEEYKETIKARIKVFIVLMVLGLLTLILVITNMVSDVIRLSDYMDGIYSGMGTGLIFSSAIFLVKNLRLLKNEEALKKSRLQNTDERNIMIAQRASQSATMVVLIVSYVGMLFMGAFNEIILHCFMAVVMVFICAYFLFNLYYQKKM